jgi:thiol-disulfide isomerase/thioredoxin
MAKTIVDASILTIFLISIVVLLGVLCILQLMRNNVPKKSTEFVLELPRKFQITQEGFKNEAPSDSYTFVMYYSPQCGHCVRAKPEYQKLGESQTIKGKTVRVKMVNPNTQPDEVMGGPKVTGYPTIRLYGPGNTYIADYEGQRTKSGFLQFLQANV